MTSCKLSSNDLVCANGFESLTISASYRSPTWVTWPITFLPIKTSVTVWPLTCVSFKSTETLLSFFDTTTCPPQRPDYVGAKNGQARDQSHLWQAVGSVKYVPCPSSYPWVPQTDQSLRVCTWNKWANIDNGPVLPPKFFVDTNESHALRFVAWSLISYLLFAYVQVKSQHLVQRCSTDVPLPQRALLSFRWSIDLTHLIRHHHQLR